MSGARRSAGVLMWRRRAAGIEVLLVHPGGPYWAKKDLGAWSIPKGEVEGETGEEETARRELEEETGFPATGKLVPLGEVVQKGGKTVVAWAVEGDLDTARIRSNTVRLEWPPRSGRFQDFPEVDRAALFDLAEARRRILVSQAALLDRLVEGLGEAEGHGGTTMAAMTIHSPAFTPNGPIPTRYTCEGDDVSPPLEWSGVPKGTKSLALIVDDPDAPDPKAPQRVFVHWVLYNLPPDAKGLPEGVAAKDLPKGTKVGTNDWKKIQYGGPCPPIGEHRYFHKLYALDTVLTGLTAPTKKDLERAMEGHVLAKAEIVGVYRKKK